MLLPRVVTFSAALAALVLQPACGGCYFFAEDVRVEGSACVTAHPEDAAGCNDESVIVQNGCSEDLVFPSERSDAPITVPPRSEGALSGSIARNEAGRRIMHGSVGTVPISVSWRSVERR